MNTKSSRRSDYSKPADPIRSIGKIVSIASFGLFVIIVAKYVDGRYHCEVEAAAQTALVSQNSDQQQRLELYQADSIRMQAELKQIDEQSVSYTELTQVQDQLLALARQNNCTLRKASPRVKGTVDFKTKANSKDNESYNDGLEDAVPEFEIHQACLVLNVAGDLTRILSFMKAIREQTWVATTEQLTLRRESNNVGGMSLEMELNFLCLQRKKTSDFGETPAPRT